VSLTPGTRLGPYEINAQIGEGGIGQVYRATDTKLKRQVAIKILPPSVAADHDRLARFRREAEVLASLNHPHIAGIFGLEESAGVTALVMELVAGEDLSQRIARGRIPIDEALAIAKQIAEALEAAHDQGIIHRDLKPANFRLRPDGSAKVLDFGLAKATDPVAGSSPGISMSPTVSAHATQPGIILGTAAYMAPEQARGKAVDKRADIWAFGVVLFEMLTGRQPFPGDDISHVLARVIERDPDWTALPPTTPPLVVRLLRRCLEKDVRRRLRDIADAKAKASAARALELDPQLAAGHTAVGYTRLHFDWNADGACRELDQAIALNPAWVDAHHWHSHALCAAARFPESLAACRRIVELDPLNPLMHAHVAWHHYMARDFEEALTQAKRVVRVEPSFHWGHFFAGWALERLGRGAEAVEALRESVRCSSNSPVMLAGLGHALAVLQDRREALRVAEDLEQLRGDKGLFAYELGVIRATLGDRDEGFRWLTRAVHERSGWIAYLRVDPRLDALHTDPRFDSLIVDATAQAGA
jgi:tetratricopeptide (TPR) repeat protein